MTTEKTRPVSTRLTLEEFAKVRDCLIEQGVPENQLMTNSNIVKTALLMIIVNSHNSKSEASSESTDIIRQLWKVKRPDEFY
jgi:phage gp16-like protein